MSRLLTILILLTPSLALADDIDLAVKYQLQLAKLTREREQPPIAKPQQPKKRTFEEAYALAVKTGKPLVVWLGEAICPSCIQATNDEFIHFADTSRTGFPSDSLTVYMRVDGGDKLKLIGWVSGWKDDDEHGHLPTVRKMIRLHDADGSRVVTASMLGMEKVWVQPVLPPITYQSQMQVWPQPVIMQQTYVQPMRAPVRFMGRGRACAT